MADCCWFVEAEDTMAEKLAALSQFQEFAGVADEIEAAEHIFIEVIDRIDETKEIVVPAELHERRPFALIGSDTPQLSNAADGNALAFGGTMVLLLEIELNQILAADPTADTPSKQIRWVKIQLGKILVDLFTAWQQVLRQTLQFEWSISNPTSGQDVPFITAYVTFQYGPEAF